MKKLPNKPIILHVSFLPIFILAAFIFLAGSYEYSKGSNSLNLVGTVLSDEDDEEDNEEDDSDDEDENEDEDDGEDREDEDDRDDEDKDDEEDNEEDNSEDENEFEMEDEEDDDSDEFNDIENEIEDEFDDDDDKEKSLERIENPDGTVSFIKREVEGDKIKIEIKTYNAAGIKIGESKVEIDGDKSESNIKEFDTLGKLLKSLEIKTEDGGELKLKIKETQDGQMELSKLKYDLIKQELEIKLEDGNLRIRVEGDNFELIDGASKVLTNFPITADPLTGQIFVTTPKGIVELKQMPDSILEKALAHGGTAEIKDLQSIKELEYRVESESVEKLLGLFPISIPSVGYYDSQTGEIIEEQISLINRILSALSF